MEPALCTRFTQSMKILALVSILTSLTVACVSSLMLHRSVQLERSPTRTTAEDLLSQVNVFFGGMIGRYDLGIIFRILKGCSATALAGGLLQFLLSLWLLMASVRESRRMAVAWVAAHVVILIAICGSFICILTTELQVPIAVQVFLPVTGIDSLLIIYFCFVVVSNFSRTDGEEHRSRRQVTVFKSAMKPETAATQETSISHSFVSMSENNHGSRDEPVQKHRKATTERLVDPSPPKQSSVVRRGQTDSQSESSSVHTDAIKHNWAKDVHFPVPKRDTVPVTLSRETDF